MTFTAFAKAFAQEHHWLWHTIFILYLINIVIIIFVMGALYELINMRKNDLVKDDTTCMVVVLFVTQLVNVAITAMEYALLFVPIKAQTKTYITFAIIALTTVYMMFHMFEIFQDESCDKHSMGICIVSTVYMILSKPRDNDCAMELPDRKPSRSVAGEDELCTPPAATSPRFPPTSMPTHYNPFYDDLDDTEK